MSFEKHSNFNKLANFSEVKFGENKPVLEVELNEMQQIQNEARADIIRDTMPSGFVTLGEIDYEHCANNNNQIKLKTESIAYVNGYRITIPKDTIIEIGESDKEREDLVFLEVWKEAVNDVDTLTEYGGENNAVINNPIKDERYPVATSQRVQLKYRIRHVADVDFNTYVLDGFTTDVNGIDGFTRNNQQVLAIGGLNPEQLTIDPNRRYFNYKQRAYSKSTNKTTYPTMATEDSGLFVAGNSNNFLNTSDGYVYAIPMFRLIRKPHVGLASPFEYKKIHNQLDPKKFAHLVGQENVEKVHSVNVKGKTFKNLVKVANSVRANQNTEVNIYLEPNTKYIAFGDFTYSSNPGTFALLCLSTVYAPNGVLYGSGDDLYTQTVMNGVGKEIRANKTLNYITFNSENYPYCHVRSGGGAGGMFSDLMLFKYEDEMEELTLEYFKGVKSLGELDNNSITVENNLVAEGTYVHELQNHILPTHPEVTHVTWGEDVVIPPEVEIELKNGEEVIQTITQLPARLETTGEEKLHVKTMKGKTLVNLVPKAKVSLASGDISRFSNVNSELNYLTATVNSSLQGIWHYVNSPINLSLLKPNTKYLVKFDQIQGIDSISVMRGGGTEPLTNNRVINSNHVILTTNSLIEINEQVLFLAISPSTPAGTKIIVSNPMIIEYQEDMENWDIPYFEGMQSVKMPVLHTVGKNLATVSSVRLEGIRSNSGGHPKNIIMKNIPVEEGKTYTISGIGTKSDNMGYISFTRYEHQTPTNSNNHTELWNEVGRDNADTTFTIPKGIKYVSFTFGNCTYNNNGEDGWLQWDNIQLEEGSIATPYEPYKSNILRTPSDLELGGIGDVQDTLDVNTRKLVQRTELIDGNYQYWEKNNQAPGEKTSYFYTKNTAFKPDDIVISNKVPYERDLYDKDVFGCKIGGVAVKYLEVRADKAQLETDDVAGFIKYLKDNDIVFRANLDNEVIKTVELTEDDYVGKSKVTYQLAEPLNNIPNGAYDEIKGDKVIKRTNKIYLDGTETWGKFSDETTTTYRTSFNIADGKPSSVCVCSHFEYGTGASVEKVKIYMTVNANLSITVLKSDFPTVDSFKTWLSNNRPMVIYELANPVEIPLKEVSPLDVDFSLNRQFKRGYDNCLKELPNGVKDVVENGKVKRNIARTIIDGTENWDNYALNTDYNTDTENTLVFMVSSSKLNTRKSGKNNYLCKTLSILEEGINIPDVEKSGVWLHSDSQYYNFVYIRVFKNWLPTPDVDGLKKWLNKNPLEILFEVQTPTTEELTKENCRYVPYMPLNSYVGSLYVADGINQTKFLTDFSPSEYEVQTSHHYFSNEFNMFEDIKRKKSPYGHKTYLEEVDGKYVEKFIAGLEKHEIEDLRHKVSLTGFDYSQLLQDSFLKLIKGELS